MRTNSNAEVQSNFIQNLKRKFTSKINPKNYLSKDDIKEQGQKQLTCMTVANFTAFFTQVAIIIIAAVVPSLKQGTPDASSTDPKDKHINIFKLQPTPVSIKEEFSFVLWSLVFTSQFLFVLVPISCSKSGQHFKNILLYKIKWAYVFQCALQTLACLTFEIPFLNLYFIPLLVFAFLKIYVHIFVYTKIKYKDDGEITSD